MSDIITLRDTLIKANQAYHNGSPIMTDDEYDSLLHQYESITGKSLDFIGATPTENTGKITDLPMWMGSMNKVKTNDQIQRWIKSNQPKECVLCDKLDGISALIEYNPSNKTMKAYTRGNGSQGTDISHLFNVNQDLKRIRQYFFNKCSSNNWKLSHHTYYIRGELIISKSSWNENRDTMWKEYSNPRNTVAGLVQRKTIKPEHKEAISSIFFVAFSVDIKKPDGNWYLISKRKMFALLSTPELKKHMRVVQNRILAIDSINSESLSSWLIHRRKQSKYEIDGIIIWDAEHTFSPNTSGNPSQAFAFKMVMTEQQAETLVENIEWQLSRQGYWKPVVVFNQVEIGGTRIKKATGHNAKWLMDRGIGKGARIMLIRSGDVIPKIHNVINSVPQSAFVWPPKDTYKWDSNKTNLIYHTNISNPSITNTQLLQNTSFTIATLKIKGLASKIIERFIHTHSSWMKSFPYPHLAILKATKEQWLQVEGVKDKSAGNFVERTAACWQSVPIEIRLISLCVLPRGIGIKQLQAIHKAKQLQNLLNPSFNTSTLSESLLSIDGFGPTRVNDLMAQIQTIRHCWSWIQTNIPFSVQQQPIVTQVQSIPAKYNPLINSIKTTTKYAIITGFRDEMIQSILDTKNIEVKTNFSSKLNSENTILITKKDAKTNSKIKTAMERDIVIIKI